MPSSIGIAPQRIQDIVLRIHSLPTLPQMAIDVAALARKEDVTMSMIAGKIDRDPAISSKLLRVANSSYYGLPRSVRTSESAILVLGLKQVANVVLGISIVKAFPVMPGRPCFERERFWAHSAAVGWTGRILCDHLAIPVNGEEFSGGVLHDIGKIVFDQYFHEDWIRAMELIEGGASSLDAERQIFGVTHAELGGWLLDHWKLPHSLARVAAFHHEPERSEDDRSLVAIVSLADELTRRAGLNLPGETPIPFGQHPGWSVLSEEFPYLASIDPEGVVSAVIEKMEAVRKRGELGWLRE